MNTDKGHETSDQGAYSDRDSVHTEYLSPYSPSRKARLFPQPNSLFKEERSPSSSSPGRSSLTHTTLVDLTPKKFSPTECSPKRNTYSPAKERYRCSAIYPLQETELSPTRTQFSPLKRPISSSIGHLTSNSLSHRYTKEEHQLKFNLRRDFYCATIWFPHFLQEYYPDLHWFRRLAFSLLVYSNFLFVAVTVNFLTVLVAGELGTIYQNGIMAEEGEAIDTYPFFHFKLNPFAVVTATMLFLMNLWSEFKLSIEPLKFWWRTVSYGNWDFQMVKMPDTTIQLVKVTCPIWSCWLRFLIVGATQIISNLVLLLVGVATIYNSGTYLDLVKDCLSFIWVTQIDEICFQYLFLNNTYFRNLWRDTVFEETVFIYTDEKIQHKGTHPILKTLGHLLSSLLGLGLLTVLFQLSLSFLIDALAPEGPNQFSSTSQTLTPINS